MTYLVQCDRCEKTANVVFQDIDTGYWTQPNDWLSIAATVEDPKTHLCPPCKARALEKVRTS